jgi:hypothetical protein
MKTLKKQVTRTAILATIIGLTFAWAVTALQADPPEELPEELLTIASEPTEEPEPVITFEAEEPEPYTPDPEEVELIGRTIWGEAGGVKSKAERAAVAWCILNRADARQQSVEEVVTAPKQFHGYRTWGECPKEHLDLAADVLTRWHNEKNGAEDVGRTLPAEYLYFYGDGKRNHFSKEWKSGETWDWSLSNPYIQ